MVSPIHSLPNAAPPLPHGLRGYVKVTQRNFAPSVHHPDLLLSADLEPRPLGLFFFFDALSASDLRRAVSQARQEAQSLCDRFALTLTLSVWEGRGCQWLDAITPQGRRQAA